MLSLRDLLIQTNVPETLTPSVPAGLGLAALGHDDDANYHIGERLKLERETEKSGV